MRSPRFFINARSRFSQIWTLRTRQYQYAPLPSATSIRLLELSPSDDSKVSCSLRAFELRDAPPFDALSYTWGNPLPQLSRASLPASKGRRPTTTSNSLSRPPYSSKKIELANAPEDSGRIRRYPIICDDSSIFVTANLKDALQMLCKSLGSTERITESRYLWIDAICVDQKNILERNLQVALMAETFKAAQKVIVWLGKEDEFTSDALTVINAISTIPEPHWASASYTSFYADEGCLKELGISHLSIFNWLGFIAFINRPWFKRAWVVQEIALAKTAVLVCGQNTLPWDKLSKTLAFIKKSRWYHHLSTEKLRHVATVRETPGVYKNLLKSKAEVDMSSFYLDRTRIQVAASGRFVPHSAVRRRKPSLRVLLDTHRFSGSTDARDKVYAFLGLADRKAFPFNTQPKALAADYKLTVQQVYTETVRALLIANKDLDILCHKEDRSRTKIPSLPSWVPDYSVAIKPYPLKFRGVVQMKLWKASGKLSWAPDMAAMNNGLLPVQGYLLDVIDNASIMREESQDPVAPWASIVRLALGLDDYYRICRLNYRQISRVEVLWRTLTTNTYARQHPAPTRAGEMFVDYILNLQIRHRLTPWSSDIDFQPQHNPLSASIYPEWHALLSAEPEGSPYNIGAYKQRLTSVVESMFNGTYSPIGLAQLQHELDNGGGTMRRLFKTHTKFLGTGPRSLQLGDELWVLAGAPVPFVLRRLPNGNHQLVGEAYVYGLMHGEALEMGLSLEKTTLE
ncbi:uncharacterized protein BDZ99DRAFT_437772 [Mytilinidion resinicola]|uniref:Heterokaryon incompatibility domain-containing protein n=1 Tax=Mytilinidion resinicola TaxID=574789 RepID=A0A6A6YYH1_9PEZI|nr:uncharacterized protein BDZ99DRAFT_437772 [Mytilinidion resinicola]KAF2812997.1 hypothetical protein BDZ99DRAFT_437772 [Mytilinidion resinicola]